MLEITEMFTISTVKFPVDKCWVLVLLEDNFLLVQTICFLSRNPIETVNTSAEIINRIYMNTSKDVAYIQMSDKIQYGKCSLIDTFYFTAQSWLFKLL